MHQSSMLRMKWFEENFIPKYDLSKYSLLDVGSYDINGSYKKLFNSTQYEYTGLDIEAGPNVDIVLPNSYNWKQIETDKYDIVISGQTFEHAEFFWLTMSEMARVLKKNGFICIITPNKIFEHRHPVDCYRFYTDSMIALARYVNFEILHAHTNCAPTPISDEWYSVNFADSMLIARKPYSGETQFINPDTYKCEPADHKKYRNGLYPYNPSKNPFPQLLRKIKRFVKRGKS